MQIQASNLVLTWLHKWVSSLKPVEQKSHHGVIKTYLGAGVHSCCREEGERKHTSSGLACAWHRSLKQGKELSNCTTFVLLCFFRAVPIPQHSRTSPFQQRVCQAAAVLCLSVSPATPHSKFVQFCRHISAPFVLLQKGKGIEGRWGVVCQLITEIYFFSTRTWMLSTVCRGKKNQNSLWLLWYHQQYRGDIASSRKMSLPTLLTLMSCFLYNWLSQTAHAC